MGLVCVHGEEPTRFCTVIRLGFTEMTLVPLCVCVWGVWSEGWRQRNQLEGPRYAFSGQARRAMFRR